MMPQFTVSSMIKLPNRYWHHKKVNPLDPRPKLLPQQLIALEKFDYFANQHLPKNEIRHCPCGSGRNNSIICNIDRSGWPLELRLCNKCGLIYVGKYWNEKQLKLFYEDWYRLTYSGGKRNPEALFNSQVDSGSRRNRYTRIKAYFPDKDTISAVDIGGACGGALIDFHNHGHKCVVSDYDIEYLEYARGKGINVVEGGLDAIHKGGEKYDLVIINHVLEHFYDLNDALAKIGDILTENGKLWVEVPAIDSLLEGRRCYDFLGEIQDAHTYYFTVETLKFHMRRHGFKPILVTTESEAFFSFDRSIIDTNLPPNSKQPQKTATLLKKAEFMRRYIWPIRRPIGQSRRHPKSISLSIRRLFQR